MPSNTLPLNSQTSIDKLDITVLICSRNSANRISKVFDYLSVQKNIRNFSWEILIADYESTDDTKYICSYYAKEILKKVPMVFLEIQEQGKTPAIEEGFLNARGEYICIVDDDNLPCEDYLSKAYKLMSSRDDIGVVGAKGEAIFEDAIHEPYWFKNFKGIYAIGDQGSEGYKTDREAFFWGAGSVFRKSAWLKAKEAGFIPKLNPARNSNNSEILSGFSGGEDPEMCYAVSLTGYKLWYEPGLIYHHVIPKNRLNKDFLLKTVKGVSPSAAYLRLLSTYLGENNFKSKIKNIIWRNVTTHHIYMWLIFLRNCSLIIFSEDDKYFKIKWSFYVLIFEVRGLISIQSQYSQIKKTLLKVKEKLTFKN